MAHNQDWREWLESLNASGAEFVVVGGIALAHHGVVRYTGDIDVLVHATPENAQRVLDALRAFGFGSAQLTTAVFWINLQSRYDLEVARNSQRKEAIAKIRPCKAA